MGASIGIRVGTSRAGATQAERLRLAEAFGGGVITAVMIVIAFVTWTALPAGILWAMPRLLGESSSLLALASIGGIALGAVGAGALLGALNNLYCRLTHAAAQPAHPPAWARPLINDGEGRCRTGVLEVVVVCSVICATIAFGVWFFGFADCSTARCAGI